jgi:hypothetical protein
MKNNNVDLTTELNKLSRDTANKVINEIWDETWFDSTDKPRKQTNCVTKFIKNNKRPIVVAGMIIGLIAGVCANKK